ncbi:MAG: hypothetical protein ACYDC2_12075, partial [Solirubrobacteraceae bacterium]
MSGPGAKACAACGSPMEPGQCYCLACGARAGVRSVLLAELLDGVRRQEPSAPPAARAGRGRGASLLAGIWTAWAAGAPRLPRPRVWTLLALGFLGFGVLMGHAAGSGNAVLAASARPHLKIVVP